MRRRESKPRGHRRDQHPGMVQVPAGGEGDIVVVDALVVPPPLLALLERIRSGGSGAVWRVR
jgi:hypothetical protein